MWQHLILDSQKSHNVQDNGGGGVAKHDTTTDGCRLGVIFGGIDKYSKHLPLISLRRGRSIFLCQKERPAQRGILKVCIVGGEDLSHNKKIKNAPAGTKSPSDGCSFLPTHTLPSPHMSDNERK